MPVSKLLGAKAVGIFGFGDYVRKTTAKGTSQANAEALLAQASESQH